MCPMCPAFPVAPGTTCPPSTRPPPTPVDTTMHSAFAYPAAAPYRCSPAAMATASPAKVRGLAPTAGCSAVRARSGNERQAGMLTGETVPCFPSTGPALPMPTASTPSHAGEAASSSSTAYTAAMTSSTGSVGAAGSARTAGSAIVPVAAAVVVCAAGRACGVGRDVA